MWNKEQKIAISLIKEIEEVGKEWDILFNFYRDVPRKKILMEIYYIQYYAVVDAVNAYFKGGSERCRKVLDALTNFFSKLILTTDLYANSTEYVKNFEERRSEKITLEKDLYDDKIDASQYYLRKISLLENRLGSKYILPIWDRVLLTKTISTINVYIKGAVEKELSTK
ncbi:MAG TPA: hypothetical protein PLM44_00875 [bacterium]|jgi:hypothetical protein|nr:hypothetical protein [bacterium]HQG58377.1 hypothetical protein [bacterium]HQG78886.1 hypothetical protein [bacterium]HQK41502.1 hypothetical protein [bacterium]HQK63440.1 hypothetical protein [Methanofastidiosum sp.]